MDDTNSMANATLDISGIIRRARRVADLSQRDLAKRAGVSQASLARWEMGQGSPDVHVFERLVAPAGFRLSVHDESGSPVQPMSTDAPVDRQGRLFPAHLDLHPDEEPYSGVPRTYAPRREYRDIRRRWSGVTPEDHPRASDVALARERTKQARREQARAAREAARARGSRER